MNPSKLDIAASFKIEAAQQIAEGQPPKNRRFTMTAYTGGTMMLAGWRYPVVVDLAGLNIGATSRPIFVSHNQDVDDLLGQSDSINIADNNLVASGDVLGDSPRVQRVIALADKGFNWQASIGARAEQVEFVKPGQSVTVNGKSFNGPLNIARKSVLGEISFVTLGADGNTSAVISANKQETTMETDLNKDITADTTVADIRAAAAAESKRITAIKTTCSGKFPEIEAKAIEDGWDATRCELEVLRANRPTVSGVKVEAKNVTPQTLEAAVLMAGGIAGNDIIAVYGQQAVETADKQFKNRIGLQQLLLEAAWANGCSVMHFRDDPEKVLRAAFSTFSLPGMLSNIANKFLLAGFESVESAWRAISVTRNVKDFKQVTSYRLTGGFEYDEVGPDGELKHSGVGEESFTNQARTYGKMFSLTRKDLINDDLGALSAVPRRIGRGGALKLNKVFWTAFLANSSFFTTGNKNYAEGAGTVLSVDSLGDAYLLFLNQVDPDSNPISVEPRILLVPPALFVKASQLMQATELRDTTASTKYLVTNPMAGKFSVQLSTYLSSSLTGNSAKAWYLLADPQDLPVIEVAFLNGKEQPTVEQAEAEFNTLGIQFRGYFDFGVALQDWRGGVKFKGEA